MRCYRHRVITEDDIVFIRRLIAEHPQLSRWSLSRKLCQEWNWVQTQGNCMKHFRSVFGHLATVTRSDLAAGRNELRAG